MKPDLDIDLLRSFATVAETRSFTAAARRLSRGQSAVSMQIKRLEEIVGRKLLDRTPRSVALTPDGETLLGYARRILRLNEEALVDLVGPPFPGPLRIGASDVASYLFPEVLARIAELFPLLPLDMCCDRSWHLLDALEDGSLDMALVTQTGDHPKGALLRREPLLWVASRRFSPEAADPLPLALFAPGCIYREAALDALNAKARPWRIAYSSINPAGLRAAVGAGRAVAALPRSTVDPGLRRLGPSEDFPVLPDIEVTLHWARGRHDAFLKSLAADLLGSVRAAAA